MGRVLLSMGYLNQLSEYLIFFLYLYFVLLPLLDPFCFLSSLCVHSYSKTAFLIFSTEECCFLLVDSVFQSSFNFLSQFMRTLIQLSLFSPLLLQYFPWSASSSFLFSSSGFSSKVISPLRMGFHPFLTALVLLPQYLQSFSILSSIFPLFIIF